MRKLAILLLLAASGPSSPAQTRVTVSQMEQLLATLHHESDGKAAHQLAGFELTERVASATLARWQAEFAGKRTRETLTALADASAFLDLPAADLPATARPDLDTQKQIFLRTVTYVSKTVPRLPNFSALRTTTYFETATRQQLLHQQLNRVYQLNSYTSDPSYLSLGPVSPGESKDEQLFVEGTWGSTVTYRDGAEVGETSSAKSRHARPSAGLTTIGEFGPILQIVNADAVHGKIFWSHWENGPSGPLAVYRYEVPAKISHYAVRSFLTGPEEFPAYHGEITVDPASGAIFRITVEAEQIQSDAISEASILVEYGPVVIGGNTYICPVRAVAISKQPSRAAHEDSMKAPVPPIRFLNDVSFTQYHVFRAEARVLSGDAVVP